MDHLHNIIVYHLFCPWNGRWLFHWGKNKPIANFIPIQTQKSPASRGGTVVTRNCEAAEDCDGAAGQMWGWVKTYYQVLSILGEWTSIYQLFWGSRHGARVLTHSHHWSNLEWHQRLQQGPRSWSLPCHCSGPCMWKLWNPAVDMFRNGKWTDPGSSWSTVFIGVNQCSCYSPKLWPSSVDKR